MIDKIIDSLKNSYIVPSILIKSYKKIELDDKETILLIYLLNQKDLEFNPQKIAKEMNIDLGILMELIENLNVKDVLSITHVVDKSIHHEYISLDNLYKKLGFIVLNEEEKNKSKNIYDIFEKEFGRTLSPIEYEIINAWLNNYNEEIILEALKEAVYNNVSNLRYIDKILSEWNKKGIKEIKDIEENKKKFVNDKHNKKELFEYDWLNSNE